MPSNALSRLTRRTSLWWAVALTLMLAFSTFTGNAAPLNGVTLSKTTLAVTEGSSNNSTDTYTVVLNSVPTSNVTVVVNGNADVAVSPSSLTFTPADWNVAQTVTVTVVNDRIYEANHSATLTHISVSSDGNYNGLTIADVTANVTDNEFIVFGVSNVSENFTPTSGAESVTTVTFKMLITINAPVGGTGNYGFDSGFQVPYSVTGGTATGGGVDYTLADGSASFTAAQSMVSPNVFIPVTATIVDDTLPEPAETIIITAGADETGTSGSYATSIFLTSFTPAQSHTYTILASDNASATVSKTTAAVTEDSTTDSYTVVLDNAPTADVTVNVTGGADVAVSPSSLTFTTSNWDTPQTVTVSAVNDNTVEGAHSGSISHTVTSADSNYNGLSVAGLSVAVTDNDSATYQFVVFQDRSVGNSIPELAVSYIANVELVFNTNGTGANQLEAPIEVPFTVGGTATGSGTDYSFNVNVGSGGPTIQSVALNSLTIQTDGTADAITVTIVNDAIDESDETVIFTLGTELGGTAGQQAVVTAGTETVNTLTIVDNDTVGVTVSQTTVSATEGDTTGSYTVVLNTQPMANVTVTVTGDAQASVSPTSLTFTTANWNTAQTVTVTAVDDAISDGAHTGAITHSASGGGYDAVSIAGVTVNITDNDTPGINSDTSAFNNITEGGASSSFTLALATQPTQDVLITLNNSLPSDATVSPASLTFTSANWNVPQAVTVGSIDDQIVEDSEQVNVTISVTSADSQYNGLTIGGGSTNIADNDTFTAEFASATSSVNEEAGSATITVNGVFVTSGTGTQSLANEQSFFFTVNDGTATSGADYTSSSTSVTFSGTAAAQTLSITILADQVDEADETVLIGFDVGGRKSSAVLNHTLTITDNDSAGVTLNKTSVAVTEGTAGDTYSAVLNSQPTADVTVTLTFDSGKITASPASLTFSSANWNTAQLVTVTADSDSLIDFGTTTITHASTSSDANYNGLSVASVTATVADASIDLLLNGSFETAGAVAKEAANWKGNGLGADDRRVCKNALEGTCAFRFKSNVAEPRFIRQIINAPAVSAGDVITFTGSVKAIDLSKKTFIWVRAFYSESNQQKLDITIRKGTYDYTLVTGSIVLTGVPTKIVITIRTEDTVGTFLIDDLELLRTVGDSRALDITGDGTVRDGALLGLPEAPAAPDGFRN